MGHAIPDNVAFTVTLPHRRSFAPDAAFYVGELRMGFLTGAPRFAVEVRSESDYGPAAERKLARKRADYFAAGTLAVWDADLPRRGRRARVSRARAGAPDRLPARRRRRGRAGRAGLVDAGGRPLPRRYHFSYCTARRS